MNIKCRFTSIYFYIKLLDKNIIHIFLVSRAASTTTEKRIKWRYTSCHITKKPMQLQNIFYWTLTKGVLLKPQLNIKRRSHYKSSNAANKEWMEWINEALSTNNYEFVLLFMSIESNIHLFISLFKTCESPTRFLIAYTFNCFTHCVDPYVWSSLIFNL